MLWAVFILSAYFLFWEILNLNLQTFAVSVNLNISNIFWEKMIKMKTRFFTKRHSGQLLNNALVSLGKSRYIHATSAVVLTSNFQRIPVKKVTIDTLINLSFQNKIKVKALNFRMPWMMIWKIAKWKTFNMLDIFVRFEAMNFSTYSASPVGKRRKLIPMYIFYPPWPKQFNNWEH